MGLKADGTVVIAGNSYDVPSGYENLTDVVDIAVGYDHAVFLKSDGTVVALGDNSDHQCDTVSWDAIRVPG